MILSSTFAAPVLPALPVKHANVSLPLASQLLDATLAARHAMGRSAVAAVIDRCGNLVALQRDDNVGPHNTLAAQRKAYTALSTKVPTSLLAQRARNDPHSSSLNTIDALLLLGGGVPLTSDGEVFGAIGVAAMDEECAMQAMRQLLPQAH